MMYLEYGALANPLSILLSDFFQTQNLIHFGKLNF